MLASEKVETVISEIGFGQWQWAALAVVTISQAVCSVQQLGSSLLSAPVPFNCYSPGHSQEILPYDREDKNESIGEFHSTCLQHLSVNSTWIPPVNITIGNRNMHFTGLPSCPLIEYDTSLFHSTVITEWDLVCEDLPFRPLFQMVFSIGSIIGAIACGYLSDKLGRKKTAQIGCLLLTVSILAFCVVPWYKVMIVMRTLTGTGMSLMTFSGYTLISEVSPANCRIVLNMLPGLTFFMGMAAFAGVGYILPHWRKLALLCSSPLIIVALLVFLMDESPRWLLQQGRSREAVYILRKAAKRNGIEITSSTSQIMDEFSHMGEDDRDEKTEKNETDEAEKGNGVLDMVRTLYTSPGMRMVLIFTPFMWFCQRAMYVGIAINANNFASANPFIYVAISGATATGGMLLSLPLSVKLTRKFYLAMTLGASGILMFLELITPSDWWMLKWIMMMTAFCLSSSAFQINYLFAAELYPTVIRTRGFTFTSLIASFGEMAVPLVTDLAVQHQWWAANVTFGVAGIVGSLILPFLPETKDKPMPETLQDVEDRYWKDYKKKNCRQNGSKEVNSATSCV